LHTKNETNGLALIIDVGPTLEDSRDSPNCHRNVNSSNCPTQHDFVSKLTLEVDEQKNECKHRGQLSPGQERCDESSIDQAHEVASENDSQSANEYA
jgi:hypothetical protein